MCSCPLPNGEPEPFYFPEDHPSMPGWFKGMEIIIQERGLWPKGNIDLLAQCSGFRCPTDCTDCCCQCILFLQPDFVSQKSQLEELVESRGHLCNFYPKYHCELNFIEQYWGAAKLQFCVAGHAKTLSEMEMKMLGCLDDIPLEQIRRCISTSFFILSLKYLCRFADRSAHFISAYYQGLSGAQVVWANKKYHSHCVLPPDMTAMVKEMVPD